MRLESVLLDGAELERLADGIHVADRDGRGRPLALPPRQRAERAQRTTRARAVPASPLLRRTVAAAHWAAERSGGLVDATLLGELERHGYAGSLGREPPRRHRRRARLRSAAAPGRAGAAGTASDRLRLDARGARRAGARRAARPRRHRQGHGRRPRRRGAARGRPLRDLVRRRPRGRRRASRGRSRCAAPAATREVHRLRVRSGGVATSGIARTDLAAPRTAATPTTCSTPRRAARRGPASSPPPRWPAARSRPRCSRRPRCCPAPLGARRLLRRRGGVLQHDDGRVEIVPAPAVVRLPAPAGGAAA